jgi:hypothetical protein
MISGQEGYKARIIAALMVVCALWATVAIAGVNEDFIEAAKRGDLPAVKAFIAKGAGVNAKRVDGATALIMASRNGKPQVVQELLEKGADIDAKASDGTTALIAASQLRGDNPVRVENPNDFSVKVGLRSAGKGKDFSVAANGSASVLAPNGRYDIYFQYSTDPEGLYQGDGFTLDGNGVEIKIVKVVGGNYGIRKVK